MTPDLSRVVWRKSTRSGGNGGNCVEVGTVWRKSSRSGGNNGACVEVADLGAEIAVRDSKRPDDGALVVPAAAWRTFLTAVSAGRHDLP